MRAPTSGGEIELRERGVVHRREHDRDAGRARELAVLRVVVGHAGGRRVAHELEVARAQVAEHLDELHDLVPGGEPRRDGTVVGRLVVHRP